MSVALIILYFVVESIVIMELKVVCHLYLRTFFDRLKARGEHTTSAQISVMRKIVKITYSLYKAGTIYDETHYEKWNNMKIAS